MGKSVPGWRWLPTAGRLLAIVWLLCQADFSTAGPQLSPRNCEAPFPYPAGQTRTWPVWNGPIPAGARFSVAVREGESSLTPEQIADRGLQVSVSADGRLSVTAAANATATCQVELTLSMPGEDPESQVLEVRPAPLDRPIAYYADFGDDLIRIFMDPAGRYEPITKSGFDQYFRRLQAHGMKRLIVWLSPFPFIADAANYAPEDWQRYERQARAILDDAALTRVLRSRRGFVSWEWLRYLMAARLNADFGPWLGQSAAEHGIALTMSYRPFEAALTKYYEVPSFADDGTYLGGFLPLSSPTVSSRPEQTGWRHYRDVLRELGHADAAELATLEFPGVAHPERFAGDAGLQVVASPFPPLSDDGYVLVRQESGKIVLRPFHTVRDAAAAKQTRLVGLRCELSPDGLRLVGVSLPSGCRYLIVSWAGAGEGPDLAALTPVLLRAKAGNRLGRETTYWVQGGATDPSRVAGITSSGDYHAEFQASEASQRAVAAGPPRLPLGGRHLVIDFGTDATVEMIDFNQKLARQNAVREIATVLNQPGFDDILLNTRSHVDLPVSMGDGDVGVRPVGLYWHERRGPRAHLGLDKAYVPRSAASLDLVAALAGQAQGIEQITTWQLDEWRNECQTAEGPRWRYARNRGTADGLRLLVEDLERTFPGRRIRMLIPPREATVRRVRDELDALAQPEGGVYGRDYYARLWPSNNHIPAVGEGAAMVDLAGLSVEPAFLGSGGYLPGTEPFSLYVRECVADLADNRGSSFRGARSYFFEAQTTLRAPDLPAARRRREQMIRHLLSHDSDIQEVILYEAADWLYFLSLSDTELCGHAFLDRPE